MNPTVQLLEPELRELVAEGKYRELRQALHGMHFEDVADVLEMLEPDEASVVFRVLPRESAGDVFASLDSDLQEEIVRQLGEGKALRVIESMDPDDRAAVLEELPAQVAQRLINAMSPENRRVTQLILGYPEESVGRLMTPDYVRVPQDRTVQQAIDHIRRHGRDAETIHWVFVVDDRGRLTADVHIRKLLLADPSQPLTDLLIDRFIALHPTDDQEEAVRVMNRYDRTALPVVDDAGVLLGIITYDDIADVAEAEATEDIQMLGGVSVLETPYLDTPHTTMLRKRGGWLALLFVGQIITVAVLSAFRQRLEAAIVLALFIPLVISCGGNSGSQAATLVTRALALDELSPGDWLRVVRRELLTGLGLGVGLGLLGVATALLWMSVGTAQTSSPVGLSLTVGLGILSVVMWGTVLGSLLPIALSRAGLDPAAASTPLVATLMDASGMLIYLGFAVVLLRGAI
ncbi:MAG: magnesium transporter [Phycisphaeraceae bacterium]|nr:magnesium transporter [Phycisphaeraceae bacterium]